MGQNVAGKAGGWGCPVLGGEGVRKGFLEVVPPELSVNVSFNTHVHANAPKDRGAMHFPVGSALGVK